VNTGTSWPSSVPPCPCGVQVARVTRYLAAFAILAATGPTLTAQGNAERFLTDEYTRSHDYDLVHQRIEVWGFSWDSLAFDGRVTTTLVVRRPDLDDIVLDAGRHLQVHRVMQGREALGFDRSKDSLIIHLAHAAGFDDTLRFVVEYHGQVVQGQGLYFFNAESGRWGRQVYSGGGTDGNPNWFPTYGGAEDKLTWEVVATVPRDLTVVSNGRLVADRRAPAGMHTVEWAQEQPASSYLVSLVAAPLVKLTDRWRGVPLAYYVAPADSARARTVFAMTPRMLETYARLVGVPFPWAKYAQVTVADYFGGMENVSATTLADWIPDRLALLDRPWYTQVMLPHEVAHNWFGNYVTTANWASYWLNEGFAQFMVGQYWRVTSGETAGEEAYLGDYDQYLEDDARRRMPLAALGSNNIYPKGSLVLRMLRLELGEQRFWAGVQRYLERHAFANATSADLQRAILEATGDNLSWFFDQWVYRAGHPEFAVAAVYDSSARKLTLTVAQTQQDTIKADSTGLRYSVPTVFQGRVTIRVGTSAGDVVRGLAVRQRAETLAIGDLPGPPTMVVFDDDNRMLKTLQFDQPTPWLGAAVVRAPNLWNRVWAVDQLALRPSDAEAGAALAAAAREGPDATVRSLAAQALSRFPAAVALAGLEPATHDTAAIVRESAVRALGAVRDPRALALARAAFADDSSYSVRAAAVGTVAQLDSAGGRDVVATALATPSYRSAVQTAALAAALRTEDVALVPALEERLGDQPLVAIALAWFASHGSSEANQALGRHRNDERPWVRRWVDEAFRQARLGPEGAASRPGK
jgi:aminopeptidase N